MQTKLASRVYVCSFFPWALSTLKTTVPYYINQDPFHRMFVTRMWAWHEQSFFSISSNFFYGICRRNRWHAGRPRSSNDEPTTTSTWLRSFSVAGAEDKRRTITRVWLGNDDAKMGRRREALPSWRCINNLNHLSWVAGYVSIRVIPSNDGQYGYDPTYKKYEWNELH